MAIGSDFDVTDAPEFEPELDVSDVPLDVHADSELETQHQIQEAATALGDIENLDADTWHTLDASERLEVLQDIENQMSGIQERPAVEVAMEPMSSDVFGGYDGERITINTNHLEGNVLPMTEFVDTIVHEGRHAYQDYAVEHPGFVSDTELVAEWADNFENYLSADLYGYELYASQPVEADAWNYASQVVAAFTSS
ncbi:MAG: hypothetical protein JXA21_13150 [Anaerolineae bacterium]|nr:hypothetical protein [Anaerolineae bacterium]